MLCFITTIKERTLRGKNFYTSPQNGWTPRGIKILVHKVDGLEIHVHKVDGSTRVKNLHKSTKWTDPTKDQDSSP